MSCLSVLETKPSQVSSFANIFSHSEGCLFILLIVSFAAQKLLSPICLFLFSLLKEVGQKDPVVIYDKECSAYVFP